MARAPPAKAMAAPRSWVAVSRTNPAEQTLAAGPVWSHSYPPMTAMAKPMITRIGAPG
jgi:hypothetical protein